MSGAGANGTLASSRLRRLARRPAQPEPEPTMLPQAADEEQCDLCGEPIPPEHRHLVNTSEQKLMCACRACTILFDRKAASKGHYKLVPDRRLLIEDFALDDSLWQSLHIPVELAFFYPSSPAGKVVGFYPGPAGATESLLELSAWSALEEANPVLRELEPDVEALLVARTRGNWIVPIDACYELVGVMRTKWRGLSGGEDVWMAIDGYFEALGHKAKPVTREGTKADRQEAAWST